MTRDWTSDDFLFVPLGGSGEIGMNANLFHYAGQWLLVDLGISFADETMPGVDIILPDISFIKDNGIEISALVVTHGHEDHLGAIPYLWDQLRCPIYATPFTMALIRGKLQSNIPDAKVSMMALPFNVPHQIGCFSVEMISLTHSIPDPAGLVLRAGGKVIFHTGDWKFDDTPLLGEVSDYAALEALGAEGVDVMIGDSTNAMVEGRTGSEADAREGLIAEIKKATGRVAVTCFASNLTRVNTLVHAAIETGRSPMLVGRALHRIVDAARSCGYISDWPDFIEEDEFDLIPRENILLICTGSQGESRSATTRISSASHPTVRLNEGDTVMFSSRVIPGNESAISHVYDNFLRRGIKVVTEEDAPIHVSGHPARGELTQMYQMIKPSIAIPVHGTARHLEAHAALAKSCQVSQVIIPDNGNVIAIGDAAELINAASITPQTIEGGAVVDLSSAIFSDRRKMLWNGSVTASVVVNYAGELCLAPSIVQKGLSDENRGDDYIAEAANRVEDAIQSLSDKASLDDELVRAAAVRPLRKLAKSMFDRRPVVEVHVMRVDALVG